MKKTKYILFFFVIFFLKEVFAEDIPKNIISLEDNLDVENQEIKNEDLEENSEIVDTQYNNETESKNLIVIDDIPEEFNDWYGVLSSDKGGLGWLMWVVQIVNWHWH